MKMHFTTGVLTLLVTTGFAIGGIPADTSYVDASGKPVSKVRCSACHGALLVCCNVLQDGEVKGTWYLLH